MSSRNKDSLRYKKCTFGDETETNENTANGNNKTKQTENYSTEMEREEGNVKKKTYIDVCICQRNVEHMNQKANKVIQMHKQQASK